jgi:hypothetical protein
VDSGGRSLNGGVRQRYRYATAAGPFRDSLAGLDELQQAAAGLAVTGIGSITQRFAWAVVQHQEYLNTYMLYGVP